MRFRTAMHDMAAHCLHALLGVGVIGICRLLDLEHTAATLAIIRQKNIEAIFLHRFEFRLPGLENNWLGVQLAFCGQWIAGFGVSRCLRFTRQATSQPAKTECHHDKFGEANGQGSRRHIRLRRVK